MKHYIAQREAALNTIIKQAGELAWALFRSRAAGEYELKGTQDYLTEADGQVERFIIEALREHFPHDAVLGEESGKRGADEQAMWVIDPIDGTANFARGIEHFCVSIAFVHAGVTELGAIYNPVSDELYRARRGGLAYKNDVLMTVSRTSSWAAATFELGWSNRVPRSRYLSTLSAMLDCGANVRRGASGALALAWVAEGRIDGYIELHMNAWDCLAGLLMVREAQGKTGDYPQTMSDIFSGGAILATSAEFASRLASLTHIPLAGVASTTTKPPATFHYPRPPISLIYPQLPGWQADLYIGGAAGATDLTLLAEHGIKTVVNCAVNLDIDWVIEPGKDMEAHRVMHGAGALRYYKLGLIDGPGNTPEQVYAGYQLLRAALLQRLPNKPSYRHHDHGNVLVHCRGGRSRSVIVVAVFLHLEYPVQFPSLQAAIGHIREKRQLHPQEWHETPKPELIALGEYAIAMHHAISNQEDAQLASRLGWDSTMSKTFVDGAHRQGADVDTSLKVCK
ncbi:inositol monophosphatase family protein [Vibrio zhugei]|uniref:Nus factor SuhB n=1 Tax=Vibrio zhugei TaxID=2479546 RepID=A0ABV7C9A3_9VIBR|nr:inositol monophosphatase family protein [Vibrio zhugei]